jgi:Tfp pilus assembly ATPase PilU
VIDYRLYCLDENGHISLAESISASDDAEAIKLARTLKKGTLKCEVWQASRLVSKLDAHDLAG